MKSEKNTNAAASLPEAPFEELEIGGAVYQTRITSKFRNRKPWDPPDEKQVRAVIPGTVQKIMVAEGDEVSPGTPLLVLEAMKMRNEIRSTVRGVIKKIYVGEGERVPKSSLLIEFR